MAVAAGAAAIFGFLQKGEAERQTALAHEALIDTAKGLNGQAVLYEHMGDYPAAEPLFQQAINIRQKALGPEHPDTASSLNGLASLYDEIGDYAKAEPLFHQAIQIRQKALGPEHPDTASSLSGLGLFYDHTGDYAEAEPLFLEALKIFQKVFGPEHRNTARSINDLAFLYDHMADYAKAEPLLQRALQIREKVLGPEHPDTASSLNNLALLYDHMGDYAKAEPLFHQALQIRRTVLGPEHPDTRMSIYGLALLKFDLGQNLEAKSLAQLSANADLAIISKILSFASEQQRLAYEATFHPYDLLSILKGSETDLALAVLRFKGIVLDSIIEDRLVAEVSKDRQHRDLVGRLAAGKSQLRQLLLQPPGNPSGETGKKIADLEQEVEHIEGQLAKHVSGLSRVRRALSVTVEQVQAVIPQQGVLIEYVRYGHYLGKGKSEPRYGAILLTAAGDPLWVPLGPAAELEKLVASYLQSAKGYTDDTKLETDLRELYDRLWLPVERALAQPCRRVIISPDGPLNFVSFATLVDPEERFLAEKYNVQYVASGRDLLREVPPARGRPTAVVFASPDFTLSKSPTITNSDRKSSNTLGGIQRAGDLRFFSTPGMQQECDNLAKMFKGWQWKADVFTGKDATKAALLDVHSPYILHLATQAFSLDQSDTKSMGSTPLGFEGSVSKFFRNPMQRSCLALAGAQTTIEAWKQGEVPLVENDGIVTAEDVAALDLKGTWLVTLSACNTGSGEARAGEGVMGLRRGFIQADAQNLLMTLWPINDKITVQIMSDFYESAHESGNASLALAEVQRNWLVNLRRESGLAKAVNLAGPFIMSSQGKP